MIKLPSANIENSNSHTSTTDKLEPYLDVYIEVHIALYNAADKTKVHVAKKNEWHKQIAILQQTTKFYQEIKIQTSTPDSYLQQSQESLLSIDKRRRVHCDPVPTGEIDLGVSNCSVVSCAAQTSCSSDPIVSCCNTAFLSILHSLLSSSDRAGSESKL